MDTNDIRYLIAAGILTISLFLMSYGVVWAAYPAVGYLAFNSVLILLASGVFMNPDIFHQEVMKNTSVTRHRNHSVQLLVNITTAVFLFQLFIGGYEFAAGFFTFMLMMSVVSNILTFLRRTQE